MYTLYWGRYCAVFHPPVAAHYDAPYCVMVSSSVYTPPVMLPYWETDDLRYYPPAAANYAPYCVHPSCILCTTDGGLLSSCVLCTGGYCAVLSSCSCLLCSLLCGGVLQCTPPLDSVLAGYCCAAILPPQHHMLEKSQEGHGPAVSNLQPRLVSPVSEPLCYISNLQNLA